MSSEGLVDGAMPFDVFEDLVPARPAKAAGATQISFSGQLSPPLVLHEDLKEGCGGQLWPAGMCLTRFLLSRRDLWRGKTILELGAGGGLVGLALALALLQESTGQETRGLEEHPPICITDLPQLLPLQNTNIELNHLPGSFIKSCCLPWGSPPATFLPPSYRRPEVILAADCVYFEPAFPLLLQTLQTLMGTDDDPLDTRDPVCWFCMKKRRKADLRFIATLKKSFQVTEIASEDQDPAIHLYELRQKKN